MAKRLSKTDQQRILFEFANREGLVGRIRSQLFPEQLKFIDDKSEFRAAQCTRRAGKSWTAGADFIIDGIKHPGTTSLYIATTRDQAKKIMYKDVFKVINRRFRLNLRFNEQPLTVLFPNGTHVYLMGMDSSPKEADKALGQKYRRVYVDESASFTSDLRHLIYTVLAPACADLRGSISMIGTPGNNTGNLYFDVTGRDSEDPEFEPGWSVHRWTFRENPHTREEVQDLIDKIISANPGIVKTPGFRQMYMNEWVIDAGSLVYKYEAGLNDIEFLPRDHSYVYTLSIDLGYEDDTAFTIAAYSDTDPNMYFVEAYKQKHMTITDVANMINFFKQRYIITKMVVDAASKQAVEELRTRYRFPLKAADKQGKSDLIEIMNADLMTGKIKCLPAAQSLIDEWKKLIWDPNSTKREELRSLPNNLADSGLYNWRMSYHYASRSVMQKIRPGSKEEVDQWWQKQARILKTGKKDSFWQRDFKREFNI